MPRELPDALGWVAQGTRLCREEIGRLGEQDLLAPCALPGWTRKHLVAHLAGNAEGLTNLATGARTGVETPMYPSPQARLDAIEQGATLPGARLRDWFDVSASALDDALARMTDEQWNAQIRTAQGRRLPASEVPWLRARELMVHAVDLATDVTFAALPSDFTAALATDIRTKRGTVPEVRGEAAEITAWLAGRAFHGVVTASGQPAGSLPPWL